MDKTTFSSYHYIPNRSDVQASSSDNISFVPTCSTDAFATHADSNISPHTYIPANNTASPNRPISITEALQNIDTLNSDAINNIEATDPASLQLAVLHSGFDITQYMDASALALLDDSPQQQPFAQHAMPLPEGDTLHNAWAPQQSTSTTPIAIPTPSHTTMQIDRPYDIPHTTPYNTASTMSQPKPNRLQPHTSMKRPLDNANISDVSPQKQANLHSQASATPSLPIQKSYSISNISIQSKKFASKYIANDSLLTYISSQQILPGLAEIIQNASPHNQKYSFEHPLYQIDRLHINACVSTLKTINTGLQKTDDYTNPCKEVISAILHRFSTAQSLGYSCFLYEHETKLLKKFLDLLDMHETLKTMNTLETQQQCWNMLCTPIDGLYINVKSSFNNALTNNIVSFIGIPALYDLGMFLIEKNSTLMNNNYTIPIESEVILVSMAMLLNLIHNHDATPARFGLIPPTLQQIIQNPSDSCPIIFKPDLAWLVDTIQNILRCCSIDTSRLQLNASPYVTLASLFNRATLKTVCGTLHQKCHAVSLQPIWKARCSTISNTIFKTIIKMIDKTMHLERLCRAHNSGPVFLDDESLQWHQLRSLKEACELGRDARVSHITVDHEKLQFISLLSHSVYDIYDSKQFKFPISTTKQTTSIAPHIIEFRAMAKEIRLLHHALSMIMHNPPSKNNHGMLVIKADIFMIAMQMVLIAKKDPEFTNMIDSLAEIRSSIENRSYMPKLKEDTIIRLLALTGSVIEMANIPFTLD